jgi:hypothetical protein
MNEYEYLRMMFYKCNISKYHKYFDEWYNGITNNQKEFFKIERENINSGNMINHG